MELAECRIRHDSKLVGQKIFGVREKYKLDILVCTLNRDGEVTMPTSSEVFLPGDKIYVVGSASNIIAFLSFQATPKARCAPS